MSTQQQLQTIRAKCAALVAKYPKCESTAGWESTITAIDLIERVLACPDCATRITASNEIAADIIIAAWEGIVSTFAKSAA